MCNILHNLLIYIYIYIYNVQKNNTYQVFCFSGSLKGVLHCRSSSSGDYYALTSLMLVMTNSPHGKCHSCTGSAHPCTGSAHPCTGSATPAREVLSGCLKEFINRNENKTKRVKICRLSLFFRQPEKL